MVAACVSVGTPVGARAGASGVAVTCVSVGAPVCARAGVSGVAATCVSVGAPVCVRTCACEDHVCGCECLRRRVVCRSSTPSPATHRQRTTEVDLTVAPGVSGFGAVRVFSVAVGQGEARPLRTDSFPPSSPSYAPTQDQEVGKAQTPRGKLMTEVKTTENENKAKKDHRTHFRGTS